MEKASENQDILELNLPREEGGGILGVVLRLYSMIGATITDSNDNKYFKINNLSDLLINTILDREERERVKDWKIDRLKEKLDELDDPGDDEINAVYMSVCFESVGEVSSYIDNFMGVSTHVEVGIL